jgi:hypothetical protein
VQKNLYEDKVFKIRIKDQKRKEVMKMTQIQQATNGELVNGDSGKAKRKSQNKSGSNSNNVTHGNTAHFDLSRYMIKLPKKKKLELPNGQIKWIAVEADYLPVAARIAWFRREHPDWSIITKEIKSAPKAIVMKAVIKDAQGRVIATARKKETEEGFSDYIEKAETGAVGRALAMCGYGTLAAPEFDEEERLADAPVTKNKVN